MTHKEVFQGAVWVGGSMDCPLQLIRGRFSAPRAKSAKITVTGLGFFELYINGLRVSGDKFAPAWTDYEETAVITEKRRKGHESPAWEQFIREETFEAVHKVEDESRHRVYCMEYDILPFVREGENTVAVALGGGWYRKYYSGVPKTCFFIEMTGEDGGRHTAASSEEMVWHPSYITESQIIRSETHDYNVIGKDWMLPSFDDSAWERVRRVSPPDSPLEIQRCPADRVIRTVTPKLIKQTRKYRVYDAGANITGVVRVKTSAAKGERVELLFSEEQDGSGELTFFDQMTWGGVQKNVIIADGSKDLTAKAEFTWYGFRYFSVTNNAEPVCVEVIHADVDRASSFRSDNGVLNWLYEAFLETQLANMHAGVPSDCPHREGRGYTGDGQNTIDAVLLTLDGRSFYEKWIEDVFDCQDLTTGHVQYTAPFVPSGGGPGGWGGAIAIAPYVFYRHFGDTELLKRALPRVELYFKYLEAHSENDLVTREEPWAWCLGDWCAPMARVDIPAPFVNNYFYVKCLGIYIEMARLTGEEGRIPEAKATMARKKQAIVDKYFNSETGDFAGNRQGSNAFALDIGLGDGRTLENMVRHYEATGMFDTGIFGTDILIKTLFENGKAQLAFDLLTSREKTSFYTQMARGATSLWEYWEGTQSRSHPMFGAVVKYFFYNLLGIRQREGTAGFGDIAVSPEIVDGMDYCEGEAKGVYVKYVKTESEIDFTVACGRPVSFSFRGFEKALEAGRHKFILPLAGR